MKLLTKKIKRIEEIRPIDIAEINKELGKCSSNEYENMISYLDRPYFAKCIRCDTVFSTPKFRFLCQKCENKNKENDRWTDILLQLAEEWQQRKNDDPYLLIKMGHAALLFLRGKDPEEHERFVQQLEEQSKNESN